jgi:enoyl-[acyl-carrier protein] reductase II
MCQGIKIMKNRICELLSIEYPIVQGPMSWISDAVLAAAVSNAGGLGILGPNAGAKTVTTDVKETAERLRNEVNKTKSLTSKPFGVNIMAMERDNQFSDACVKVVIDEAVKVVCLCGDQPERYINDLKGAGIKTIYRALPINNLEEAKKSEQKGVDAFVAVGYEGGGHLGSDAVSTFVLVHEVAEALNIPVLAGGGIVDAKGMVAAMILGAEGVFMGTRFIATKECTAHDSYKQAIVNATDTSTATFSGIVGFCRAFKTPLVQQFIDIEKGRVPEPEENQQLHRHASRPWITGDWDLAAFPVSVGSALIKDIPSTKEVIDNMVTEANRIFKQTGETRL